MTAVGREYDQRLRSAMFSFLDRLMSTEFDGSLRSSLLNTFTFEGRPQRLIVQSGIWKPRSLDAALTIRTTYTPADRPPPYVDHIGGDGFIRYKYRGEDPQHSDNRSLRVAMQHQLPLAYFVGVDKGLYVPLYPGVVGGRGSDPSGLHRGRGRRPAASRPLRWRRGPAGVRRAHHSGTSAPAGLPRRNCSPTPSPEASTDRRRTAA